MNHSVSRLLLIFLWFVFSGVAQALPDKTPRKEVWVPNGAIYAIVVTNGVVYLGGSFDRVRPATGGDGMARTNLAALDLASGRPTDWAPNPNAFVSALAVGNDTVFAGGGFTEIGGEPRNLIAAIDGATGRAKTLQMPVGLPNNWIWALAVNGDTLYVGGSFYDSFSNEPEAGLKAFNLATDELLPWKLTMGTADSNYSSVWTLVVAGETLYVGGTFDRINGETRRGLAAFHIPSLDLTRWNPPLLFENNLDFGPSVFGLALAGQTVYVTGDFKKVGDWPRPRLAAVDAVTGQVTPWEPRINGYPRDLAISDRTIYVSGTFPDSPPSAILTALDLDTGDPIGWQPKIENDSGQSLSYLGALAVSGSQVFAGGEFGFVGGESRPNFAVFEPAGPPIILTQPADQFVGAKETGRFRVWVSGAEPLSYRWQFKGEVIPWATNDLLLLPGAQPAQDGEYSVVITNAFGSARSAGANLTVTVPPRLIVPPVRQAARTGDRVSFFVKAAGAGPLAYQWYLDGTALPGATNAFFILAAVQLADAGNYQVEVGNAEASVRSEAARLTVLKLAIQPLNQAVVLGQKAVFQAEAGGSGVLSYQWRLNGTDLMGATNASLILTNVNWVNVGRYQVVVANGQGAVQSDEAFLSVLPIPSRISTESLERLWLPDGPVKSLATTNGILYVGGEFGYLGPQTGGGVLLNVDSEERVPSFPKMTGQVSAVIPDSAGGWFLGGRFSLSGGRANQNLVRIRADFSVAKEWNLEPATFGAGGVTALARIGKTFYVGGDFSRIQGQSRTFVAALDAETGRLTPWRPSMDGMVNALAAAGRTIYIGGAFKRVNGQNQPHLAAFSTETGQVLTWNPRLDGAIGALTVSEGILYAGGLFLTASSRIRQHAAAWDVKNGDLTPWNPEPNGAVLSLAAGSGAIYVGGAFMTIGGQVRKRLAAIDVTTGRATAWDPSPNDVVKALTVSEKAVYAGGDFTRIGQADRNRIAALDGASGLALDWDPKANSGVRALAIEGESICMGGDFSSVGGVIRHRLAALDLSTGKPTDWNPSPDDEVETLVVSRDRLYVGGGFLNIGGQSRKRIAAIDIASGQVMDWNPGARGSLLEGVDYALVTQLLPDRDLVYVAGVFENLGGQPRGFLGAVDATIGRATSWNPNPSSSVVAMAIEGKTLYVGGDFEAMGGERRHHLAAFDVTTGRTTTWNPISDGFITTLLVANNRLYVGGLFLNSIEGQPRSGVAAFDLASGDLSSWDPQGSARGITALAAAESTVFAGLYGYPQWGSERRNGIASWDGLGGFLTSWDPSLADGELNVSRILASRDSVIVGGKFKTVNGDQQPYLAMFPRAGSPAILTQPLNQSAFIDQESHFEVVATGEEPLRYQWSRDGLPIENATNAVLAIKYVRITDGGSYSVVISNDVEQVTSTEGRLTVAGLPVVTGQPLDQTIGAGAPATFSVAANGLPPFSFQWRFNGKDLDGETRETLLIARAQASSAGSYEVRVGNPHGFITSRAAVLTVATAPILVRHPRGGSLFAGRSLALGVEAFGESPLSFQWLRNGVSLPDATSPTLQLNDAKSAHAGEYAVRVTNPAGTTLSSTAVVSVISPPLILSPPSSQTVANGESAVFRVDVISAGPVAFQWLLNGAPLLGQTKSSLIIPSVGLNDAGLYSVMVRNSDDSIESEPARLVVGPSLPPKPVRPSTVPREDFWVPDGSVYALIETNGVLYLAGYFSYVGPNAGSGMLVDSLSGARDPDFPKADGPILAIEADGSGGWFVGGHFSSVGRLPRANLAHIRSDLTVDPMFTPDPNDDVVTLAARDGRLFVGGRFTVIEGQTRNGLAALEVESGDLSGWNPAPRLEFQGVKTSISALAIGPQGLYVGGFFHNIGGRTRAGLAAVDLVNGKATPWDPRTFAQLMPAIYALAVQANTVYVGGYFTIMGGQERNGLAGLDAVTGEATPWNPALDPGHYGQSVKALAVDCNTVYVAGSFDQMGGKRREGIAAVDATTGQATSWNPTLERRFQFVDMIAVSGDRVYLGGTSGERRGYLAAFDSVTGIAIQWSPSVSGGIRAIVIARGLVCAGGGIERVGGVQRNGLAAIDMATGRATSWNPNVNGFISTMALSGQNLYLGGSFYRVGGEGRANLAAVDLSTGLPTSWNPGAGGPGGGSVEVLVASGNTIYAGGSFRSIGGQPRRLVAALDAITGEATAWNPNPLFTPDEPGASVVRAIQVLDQTVFVGGSFTNMGGQVRNHLAALDAKTGSAQEWDAQILPAEWLGEVSSLALSDRTLFVGGTFESAGGLPRTGLAALDAATGRPMDWNVPADRRVHALTIVDTTLFAAGDFTTIGGVKRSALAALDIPSGKVADWNPSISGDSAYLAAMAVSKGNVYVGGSFDLAGGRSRPWMAAFPPVDAPVITQQPGGQRATVGQTVKFEVVAVGKEPLTYQWLRNGSKLLGEILPALIISNAQVPDSGVFSVLVTNSRGTVSSVDVSLIVVVPPAIESQPQPRNAVSGASLDLTVGATGSPPPGFQWRLNGVNIPGATAATLRLSNVLPADSGNYSVVVANLGGAVSSQAVELMVASPPLALADDLEKRIIINSDVGTGSGDNSNATRRAGEPDHAGKIGNKSVWMAWRPAASGVATFTTRGSSFDTLLAVYTSAAPDAPANLAQLDPIVSDDDRGGYLTSEVVFNALAGTEYLFAVDGIGKASGHIVLSWKLAPGLPQVTRIYQQPAGQTVAPGATATFSVTAFSSKALGYQWVLDCLPITGETNAVLTVRDVQAEQVGSYRVRVRDGENVVESAAAFLQINFSEGVPFQKVASRDKLADRISTSAAANPVRSGLRTDSIAVKSSALGSGLARGFAGTQIFNTFGATKEPNEPNHCGEAGGASVWFSVLAESDGVMLVSTEARAGCDLCGGTDFEAVLAVYAGPENPLGYDELTLLACDHNNGLDRRAAGLTFPALKGQAYHLVVDGVNGSSGRVQLTYQLALPPSIVLQPIAQTVAAGSRVMLSVEAKNVIAVSVPLSYQWRFKGAPLLSATNSTLILANVQLAQAGLYSCVVSNFAGASSSLAANVEIQADHGISLRSGGFLSNGSFRLLVTGNSGPQTIIGASTNLMVWQPVFTNFGSSPFEWVDLETKNQSTRFYRAEEAR